MVAGDGVPFADNRMALRLQRCTFTTETALRQEAVWQCMHTNQKGIQQVACRMPMMAKGMQGISNILPAMRNQPIPATRAHR